MGEERRREGEGGGGPETPRGQEPAPAEIHRHPEWERDSQRHPETQHRRGTWYPLAQQSGQRLGWRERMEEVGVRGAGGQRRGSGKREQSPGKSLPLAAAGKSFCQKMVI